jgi:hypothetical protein
VSIPVWNENMQLTAVDPDYVRLGPGWGTALTASLLTMFACVVHLVRFNPWRIFYYCQSNKDKKSSVRQSQVHTVTKQYLVID